MWGYRQVCVGLQTGVRGYRLVCGATDRRVGATDWCVGLQTGVRGYRQVCGATD